MCGHTPPAEGLTHTHQVFELGEGERCLAFVSPSRVTPGGSGWGGRGTWPRVADTLGTGTLPSTPAPGKRHAYPGTGSSQRLSKGLKLCNLVVLHQLGQAAMAVGVP